MEYIMRKSYIIIFFLLTAYLQPSLSSEPMHGCHFSTETTLSSHKKLKSLIHQEMLRIPNTIEDKELLKKLWFEGGHRNKILRIISKKGTLSKVDLRHLKLFILQEKKLLPAKIKKITDTVNQNLFNKIFEALKFKKSEQEIEELFKEVEISADELTTQENQTYDAIINEINNLNAHK